MGWERGGAETIRIFSSDNKGATGIIEFAPPNVKGLSFLVVLQPTSLRTWLRDQLRPGLRPLSLLLVPIVDRFCGLAPRCRP